MIGKIHRAPSFGPTIDYVLNAEKGELLATHNIVGDSSSTFVTRMDAVASASRTKKPVYHLIISWDPEDNPTTAQMKHVATRLLERLGLSEHQAVVARHTDRNHPHIHIVANRVHLRHGETRANGTRIQVWLGWGDLETIERTLRALEREYGWRQVEGKNSLEPDRASGASSQVLYNEGLPRTDHALTACLLDAREGSGQDQFRYGRMHELGAGVSRDLREAVRWYGMAAEQGHNKAQRAHARCEQQLERQEAGVDRSVSPVIGLPALSRSSMLGKKKHDPGFGAGPRRRRDDDEYGLGV